MTKRIFALALVLLMIVPIIACGADDAKQPAQTTPKAGETTAAPATTEAAETEPDYKPVLPEVRYEGEQEIPLYSDLRVMARNYSKNVLFTDLYAKVVAKEGKDLRLRFTHINGDYQYLVEKMEREDERRR